LIVLVDPEYRPRRYQLPVFKAIENGVKRILLVWHRRAGKDKTCWEILLSSAFETAGNYWYAFPEYSQGRKAFWQSIDSQGKRIIDYIPAQLLYKNSSDQEMIIYLKTRDNIEGKDPKSHSTIQVVGADKPDSLRGSNPKGVIASEFSEWKKPSVYETIIEPVLVENGGWFLANGTPKGRNALYYLYEAAKQNKHWYTSLLTIEDTSKIVNGKVVPVISQEDIQNIRDRKQTPEEIILQEYYCDFNAPVSGTYYAQQLDQLHERGNVKHLPYNPKLKTYTGWDFGVGASDLTAVWWLQADLDTGMIYAINYKEWVSTAIETICHEVNRQPYNVHKHIAPHDVMTNDSSMQTRFEKAKNNGVNFHYLSDTVTKKARKPPIADGIAMVRSLLPRMMFCEKNASEGLECLRNYKRKYNADECKYDSTPIHDKYSHGADALRAFAVWWDENEKHEKLSLKPSTVNVIVDYNYLGQ
jgi:phage terminase large subunit